MPLRLNCALPTALLSTLHLTDRDLREPLRFLTRPPAQVGVPPEPYPFSWFPDTVPEEDFMGCRQAAERALAAYTASYRTNPMRLYWPGTRPFRRRYGHRQIGF